MNNNEDFMVRQTDVEIQEIFDQVPKNTAAIEDINGKLPEGASTDNPLTDKEYVDGKVAEVTESVSNEAEARQQADETLDGKIAANAQAIAIEKTRAEGAEGTLQDNIDVEALARQQVDTTLQGNIDAEALSRQQADQALDNAKQNVISDLVEIRSGAGKGATSVQPADIADFITKSVDNLVNYYLKSETYTKSEVQQLIDAIKQFRYEVAATLPTASADTVGIIYLIPATSPKTSDVKDEYITILDGSTYKWEKIGQTTIDLSNYSTTAEMNTAIASALTAYSTTTQMNTAIANAIASALASYYTKNETDVLVGGKLSKAISITYAALKALRDGGTLSPGQLYRITDFVTTVASVEDSNCGEVLVRSAGHPFDVLVRADSATTLSETAWAAKHDGDTYFQNAHLEAWQLKYCLDNDTTRFAWADTENGKGVIYEMQDEWKNVLPYDFKNIQFKRFAIKGQSHLYVNSDYPTEMDDDGYVTDVLGAKLTINTLNPTDQQRFQKLGAYLHPFQGYYSEQYIYDDGYSDSWDGLELEDGGTRLFAMVSDNYDSYGILAEVDKSKAVWCHTFGKVTAFTQGETEDVSLTGRTMDFHLAPNIASDGKTSLHNSVMVSNQNRQYRNTKITGVFVGNTISGDFRYSSVSGEIYSSSISGNIYALSVSGNIECTSVSGSFYNTSVSGNFRYSSISGYINRVSVSGYIYNTSVSGEIYRSSISGSFSYSSVSGYMDCVSVSGYIWYTSVSGSVYNTSVSGYIQYTSISGSITYATIKGYCYYLQFPALQHCIVAGNLPEGGGWDDLLEVDFSGEDYEQVITRNANDEIVVRPLYAI